MIQLSNRTYPMLQVFATAGTDYYMRYQEAQAFDQRPFRALLVHNWIAYRPGRGFHITREGRKAWEMFEHTSIERNDTTKMKPLTRFFDPTAYGLALVPKKVASNPKPAGSARDAINQIRRSA